MKEKNTGLSKGRESKRGKLLEHNRREMEEEKAKMVVCSKKSECHLRVSVKAVSPS